MIPVSIQYEPINHLTDSVRHQENFPNDTEKQKHQSRAYYLTHREEILEKARKYHLAHPDVQKKASHKWYEKNRKRLLEKNRMWAESHPEKMKEYGRKYHRTHREKVNQAHRERHNECCRKWRKAHPEKTKKTYKKYRETHLEKVREKERKYRLNFPEKRNAKERRRRTKLYGLSESFTWKEWMEKVDKTNGICPGFGVPPHFVGKDQLTLDHTPSIARAPLGFVYKIENISPLCRSCNARKGAKL